MKNSTLATGAGFLVAAIAVGAWFWQRRTSEPPAPPPAAPSAASAPVAAAPVASAPAILYPVEPAASQAAGPPDIEEELAGVFGRRSVQSLFQVDAFSRRLVATIDNLGRTSASARMWPLNPAPGQFTVEKRDDASFVSPDNGLRYTPYVLLAETADLRQVVALYTRIYPQLQQAYEELGYPGRYFNDRLVQVIDQLLATPEVDEPLEVRLPPLDPSLHVPRPWVLYEFADPALQSLSAGQKMLLRMGPVNERRIKARLAELRRLLTTPPTR